MIIFSQNSTDNFSTHCPLLCKLSVCIRSYIGLNFPTVKRMVDPSALGLPMDYLGPFACDSLAIQLITASTGTWDVLQ